MNESPFSFLPLHSRLNPIILFLSNHFYLLLPQSSLSFPILQPFIFFFFVSSTLPAMSEEYGSTRGGCCRCCISFIITSGFTALFMWLSLRGSNPSCSIQDFIVPALNVTDNLPTNKTNHTIFFDLKLQNGMKDKGVHYDAINLTFYYGPNSTSPLIGNITLPGFYQGHGKTAHRTELVETHGVQWWKDAYPLVSNGSSVVFRIDLNTRIRYKILSFYTKRHGLVIGGNVDVDASGRKVAKKGVQLKSLAVATGSQYCLALVVFSFAFYCLSILL